MTDQACTAVLLISFYGISAGLYSLGRSIYRLASKKEVLQAPRKKKAIDAAILSTLILVAGAFIHFVPNLLFNGVTWEYLAVWNPISVQGLHISLCTLLFVVLCNTLIKPFRKDRTKKPS